MRDAGAGSYCLARDFLGLLWFERLLLPINPILRVAKGNKVCNTHSAAVHAHLYDAPAALLNAFNDVGMYGAIGHA